MRMYKSQRKNKLGVEDLFCCEKKGVVSSKKAVVEEPKRAEIVGGLNFVDMDLIITETSAAGRS